VVEIKTNFLLFCVSDSQTAIREMCAWCLQATNKRTSPRLPTRSIAPFELLYILLFYSLWSGIRDISWDNRCDPFCAFHLSRVYIYKRKTSLLLFECKKVTIYIYTQKINVFDFARDHIFAAARTCCIFEWLKKGFKDSKGRSTFILMVPQQWQI